MRCCREALDALAARSPLVEVGAGLGYWAHLLRRRGVPVQAYDSHPTSAGQRNKYHGRIPCFTQVKLRCSLACCSWRAAVHTVFTPSSLLNISADGVLVVIWKPCMYAGRAGRH